MIGITLFWIIEAGSRPLIQLVSWGQNRNKNTSKYSHDSSYNLPFTLKTWFVREMIKLRLGNKSFYLSMKFMIIQIGTFLWNLVTELERKEGPSPPVVGLWLAFKQAHHSVPRSFPPTWSSQGRLETLVPSSAGSQLHWGRAAEIQR